ncbi:cellulase family glycosylhydrolase [Rhodocytophaga rosea]|uniref:Cellulase family glycosylhydrolase n=1 Tax=Rhodocytophaga rosea TaxID=2704465 RepID=A0A6C0GSV5_9BACT|nr:cellulase family glycosylhydrolase [Rhodocytophaga rosea]QHT71251.1 cellulase family glycosylhydrolase [Rhodocytophaga rosea]
MRYIPLLILLLAACQGKPTEERQQQKQQPKPISLHPNNGHYFLFRDKPTVLITSGEHYGAVLNLDFDYITYLNALQADSLNYTRIFTGSYVEDPGAFDISKNTLAPAEGRFICPWKRSDTPGYDNGGNKFDLNTWDEAYFKRLKDFVAEAGKRGIVVEVTLFTSLYGWSDGWKSSPLHPENNINGTDSLIFSKVQTLENRNILPFQEKMVKKIVSELKEYDNVFYEIQNEPWADNSVKLPAVSQGDSILFEWQKSVEVPTEITLAWQKRMAEVITTEEASHTHKHLIAQNYTNFAFTLTETNPAVSIFNFHYAHPEAVQYNYHLNKVIGFDESGFAGSADSTYRKQAWRFMMAGGGLFNNLDYSFTVAKPDGTDQQKAPGGGSPALRKQLSELKKFMESLDFIHLKPAQELVKNADKKGVFVLANSGKEYALFAENTVSEAIGLELAAGKYSLEWLNPENGTSIKTDTLIHSTGTATLSMPVDVGDIALHIRQTN